MLALTLGAAPSPGDERWKEVVANIPLMLKLHPLRGSRNICAVNEGAEVGLIPNFVDGFDAVMVGNQIGFLPVQ